MYEYKHKFSARGDADDNHSSRSDLPVKFFRPKPHLPTRTKAPSIPSYLIQSSSTMFFPSFDLPGPRMNQQNRQSGSLHHIFLIFLLTSTWWRSAHGFQAKGGGTGRRNHLGQWDDRPLGRASNLSSIQVSLLRNGKLSLNEGDDDDDDPSVIHSIKTRSQRFMPVLKFNHLIYEQPCTGMFSNRSTVGRNSTSCVVRTYVVDAKSIKATGPVRNRTYCSLNFTLLHPLDSALGTLICVFHSAQIYT